MLLSRTWADPTINLALELFLRATRDVLGQELLCVLVYGSILFDDLAPGYGDLDLLTIIKSDLSDAAVERLVTMRWPLRSGDYGVYCQMIEGAFLPRHMLDPTREGKALWWGTSGERPRRTNELGAMVLHTIRERGAVIWGQDVRQEIPPISRRQIIDELLAGCEATRPRAKAGSLQSLDHLFTAARELLWLKEGRLSCKSEAADWGVQNAKGAWRKDLSRAKFLRQNPLLANCADVKKWLAGLDRSILEAIDELEAALRQANG